MKKKNTGNEQSNQGHRAKMNSSDRSGLEQDAEGWTQVIGKRDKKKLRKDQKKQEQESAKKDSRSRRRARRSRDNEASPPTPPPHRDEDRSDEDQVRADADKAFKRNKEGSEKRDKSGAPVSFVSLEDAMLHADTKHKNVWVDCPRRDVDPSVCAPDSKVIKQVVELLRADPSQMPVVELGAPSTKRRERALKRLKNALSINHCHTISKRKGCSPVLLSPTLTASSVSCMRWPWASTSATETMQRTSLRRNVFICASSCAVKVTMLRKSIWRCRSSRHLLVSGTSRLWRCKVGSRRKKLLAIINKLKFKLRCNDKAKQRLPAPVLIRTVPALALAQVRLPTLLPQTPGQSSASLLKCQMRQMQMRARMI